MLQKTFQIKKKSALMAQNEISISSTYQVISNPIEELSFHTKLNIFTPMALQKILLRFRNSVHTKGLGRWKFLFSKLITPKKSCVQIKFTLYIFQECLWHIYVLFREQLLHFCTLPTKYLKFTDDSNLYFSHFENK